VYNGLLYVVDTGNQRMQVCSTDGEFISSFGSSGLGLGQFLNIIGIDSDDDGNVYVTDKGNGKIEKFSTVGELLESFSFYFPSYVFAPEAIAVGPLGDMFVVNSDNGRILHLYQSSDLQLSLTDQIGPYPDIFENITDMAIGINGELLVIDSPTHSIQSFETEFFEPPAESYFVTPAETRPPSKDQIKPVIIARDSLIVEAQDMLTDVFVGNANATDASGIKIIINNAPDAFKPGITNLIWIAFDNTGLSSTDNQRITVNTCGKNYSDYNLIEGTLGDDVISGTDGDDTIRGNSGNDILKGQSGNDLIYANSGSDVIDGGSL